MKIHPSNCNTWLKCSAYCKAIRNIERTPMNQNQLEGLALHKVIEQCLLDDRLSIDSFIDQVVPVKNKKVVVTEEMSLRAVPYLKYIGSIRSECKFYGIEFEVQMGSIHQDYKGIIDYFQYNENTKTLTVVDYKDGWGKVSPIDNYTMISYVIGVLDRFPGVQVDNYEIVIFQPRWSSSPNIHCIDNDYINTARVKIKSAFLNALNGPYVENAGEHCKYCPVRNNCRSFNNAIENLYIAFQHTDDREEYDIGKRLDFLEHVMLMIKSALTIETEIAENKMKGGDVVNGWGLKEGRGSWKFKPNIPTLYLKEICRMQGLKAGAFKPFTPTQLSKAGLSKEVLNALTERINGKSKLVRVSPEEAKSIFNKD